MITKSDAITTGKAIIKMLPEISKEQNSGNCQMMRGVLIYAMDSFWYTIPMKTRLQFLNKDNFFDECGWE